MNNSDQIVAEFASLIDESWKILTACGWNGGKWDNSWPSEDDYLRIRTRASNLIRRVCGVDSEHHLELKQIAKDTSTTRLAAVVGVLEAAKADFEGGLLFNLKALIEAEVLGDFLDQAEVLLAGGYYGPAASLIGAVLEDTLRKISDAAKITHPAKTKIDSLNVALAKAAIYSALTQKQVTALADIRNNADHGHFDKFTPQDVEDMLKWVRRFASEHLN